MIKEVERPTFDFPVCPVYKTMMNPDGTTAQEKNDKMDIYIWKKDYELVHSRKAEFTKKEKRVFPIILDNLKEQKCSKKLKKKMALLNI